MSLKVNKWEKSTQSWNDLSTQCVCETMNGTWKSVKIELQSGLCCRIRSVSSTLKEIVCHQKFYGGGLTWGNQDLRKITLVRWTRGFGGGEDKGGTCSWKVVLEEFFLSSCILKYLLCTRDTMKTKLFLSHSSLKSVGSHAGECMCQGNKEAMRTSSKGQHPSSHSQWSTYLVNSVPRLC